MADLQRKGKSLYASTANTFGTGDSETITPASVSGLPTDTEITLTFDRVDSGGAETPDKMERIIGVITGANFVSRVTTGRGADGTDDAAHTSPVVEYIPNAKDMNDKVDWAVVEHGQAGKHSDITASTISASTITASAVTGTNFAASQVTYNVVKPADVDAVTGATPELDLDVNNQFTLTLSEAATLTVENETAGQIFTLEVIQDDSGTEFEVTWMSTVHWGSGTAPTMSTGADEVDLLVFRCTAANVYQGFVVDQDIKAV